MEMLNSELSFFPIDEPDVPSPEVELDDLNSLKMKIRKFQSDKSVNHNLALINPDFLGTEQLDFWNDYLTIASEFEQDKRENIKIIKTKMKELVRIISASQARHAEENDSKSQTKDNFAQWMLNLLTPLFYRLEENESQIH